MAGTQLRRQTKASEKAQVSMGKFATPAAESAKGLWYAGLGVFSVAQAQSSKLISNGNKLFDKLVKEGGKLEKKTVKKAETKAGGLKHDVETRINEVREQAKDRWNSIENVFDERVSAALERLDIPTSKDLNKLTSKIQKLSRDAVRSLKEVEQVALIQDKLEKLFEDRITDLIRKVELADQKVIQQLSAELKAVSDQLNKLEQELSQAKKAETQPTEAATV